MTEVYQVGPGGEVTPASETGAALTPAEIVEQLDRYIVGQDRAKKAVAIALRNRTRRQKLPDDIRDEIIPKNILMIGPTGVGKTEIARRLAALAGAPFVKVEATKFTEVGYVGRDVDSMVRDLVQVSYRMVEAAEMKRLQARAKTVAADRLLDLLQPPAQREENPFQTALGRIFAAQHGGSPEPEEQDEPGESNYEKKRVEQNERLRARLKKHLEAGDLDERQVEIEVDDPSNPFLQVFSGQGMEEMGLDMSGVLGPMAPRRRKKRTVSVAEARQILEEQAARDLVDQDKVSKDAIELAEQTGIIFVDEIDKVAGRGNSHESGPQVSREGVQRDILPIVEGATVVTKYGPCRTDHVLFIAVGAFHMSKPSDLIPELQGRLPIRVELDSLSQQDFVRILTEPKNALVKQYAAMLGTEGVTLEFTDDGIEKIAEIASDVNSRTENIGARRLHTVMEKLLEDVSFEAAQMSGQTVRIDGAMVSERLGDLASDEDLSRYIL